MNNLCADIGFASINRYEEQLCGDHVEVVDAEDDSTTLVLADGLGSGVKASILSTLTGKIISTMVANGLSLKECVSTIAATLPVCATRGVAYSTFTIIRLMNNAKAEIIQYDNPKVILLRDGAHIEFPSEMSTVDGKEIYRSVIDLKENDLFLAMSDGVLHAGVGKAFNFGWQRENVIRFMEPFYHVSFTAKTLCTMLLDECTRLYGGQPGDDATVCAIRIRRRAPVHLMIGLPLNRDEDMKMMSLFFAKEGKHVVCGGATSSAVAKYLNKPLIPKLDFADPEIPPTAVIDGVDLTTEGVITINRVLQYARNYLKDNDAYIQWSCKKDGASQIARVLFEEATDINFYVGRAINPAHQNPNLPISFNIKLRLIEELSEALSKMGKRIKVSYF